MRPRRETYRLLIYSHDTFGLGHLRRCRTIAHALVEHRRDMQVMILSGSPIIGSFSFRNRVDFVRIPGVIKLKDGEYTALSLDIGIEEIVGIRSELIRHTAQAFQPDLFLVDKEPLGMRGEARETLLALKAMGVPLILGLRDVIDEPGQLADEWERKNAVPALVDLYDEIWLYGWPAICNTLEGVDLPEQVRRKTRYTGYLARDVAPGAPMRALPAKLQGRPYILVTTGGGGDGDVLVDWVLRAYETDREIPHAALIVLGPFMQSRLQGLFLDRAARLPQVAAITFDANVEALMHDAAAIVAMGGYNTFCEILSFDKPALIVPRQQPRLEQVIRAERAQALGLVETLSHSSDTPDPAEMSRALRALPYRRPPSTVRIEGLLDGLDVICSLVDARLERRRRSSARLSLVRTGA